MLTSKKHMIDILFPIILFFSFALCAMIVLLLTANVYHTTVQNAEVDYTAETSIAYIIEKIHQNNETGAIITGEQCESVPPVGPDSLIIRTTREDAVYTTCIYCCDGYLRELFVRGDTAFSPEDGTKILELSDFSIEPLTGSLIRITCTDPDGRTSSAVVNLL